MLKSKIITGVFISVSVSMSTAALASPLTSCDFLDPSSWFYQANCVEHGSDAASSAYAVFAGSIGLTTNTFFANVVMPTAKPVATKALTGMKAADFRIKYESLRIDAGADEEADIYGMTAGLSMDKDRLSYGILLPYDYMDFDSPALKSVNQTGPMLFVRYKMPIADERYTLGLSGNVNYLYTNYDFKEGNDDINTFGSGIGASFTVNTWKGIVPSIAALYQYADDDTDVGDYNMIKLGGNVALLPNDNTAVNLFAYWTNDLTDYRQVDGEEFWDIGIEVSYLVTQTFDLTFGYKRVASFDNVNDDQFYLGTVWTF